METALITRFGVSGSPWPPSLQQFLGLAAEELGQPLDIEQGSGLLGVVGSSIRIVRLKRRA
jgi:hypothetical protein